MSQNPEHMYISDKPEDKSPCLNSESNPETVRYLDDNPMYNCAKPARLPFVKKNEQHPCTKAIKPSTGLLR